MRRRQLLCTSAALLTTGLAGCSSSSEPAATGPPCPTEFPVDRGGDFSGDFRVVCNETTDTDETTLVPDTRSASLPGATIEFTFTNRDDRPFSMHALWSIHKKVEGDWYDVTIPKTVEGEMGTLGEPPISVPPGESRSWTIAVDNSELSRVLQPVVGRPATSDIWPTPITARGLGGGDYAFRVSGFFSEGGERPPDSPWFGYATPFSLEGEPLPLEPTNAVENVRRENGTVVVRTTANPSRVFTLTRTNGSTDEGDETTRLITEQLYGSPALRDALAHFEDGVERVRVELGFERGSSIRRPFGTPEPPTLSYRGESYSVSTERASD